jgi:Lipase (class 3)/Lipase 3 N-terminal region
VSLAEFGNFNLFEQYSAAAYCANNFDSSGTTGATVTCPAGNCPLVQAATTFMLTEFTNPGITGVTGFVAADITNNLIVVSFRGSSSIRNWITNLQVELIDTDFCDGCQAHVGFLASWETARNQVLDAINIGAELYPSYQLVVTGHSLGAAIATLAAAELRNLGYDAVLVSLLAVLQRHPMLSDIADFANPSTTTDLLQ